jgi:hypothetical protein
MFVGFLEEHRAHGEVRGAVWFRASALYDGWIRCTCHDGWDFSGSIGAPEPWPEYEAIAARLIVLN